ncbi:hypothetical protein D3C80_1526300 [compost metagenome]
MQLRDGDETGIHQLLLPSEMGIGERFASTEQVLLFTELQQFAGYCLEPVVQHALLAGEALVGQAPVVLQQEQALAQLFGNQLLGGAGLGQPLSGNHEEPVPCRNLLTLGSQDLLEDACAGRAQAQHALLGHQEPVDRGLAGVGAEVGKGSGQEDQAGCQEGGQTMAPGLMDQYLAEAARIARNSDFGTEQRLFIIH